MCLGDHFNSVCIPTEYHLTSNYVNGVLVTVLEKHKVYYLGQNPCVIIIQSIIVTGLSLGNSFYNQHKTIYLIFRSQSSSDIIALYQEVYL